ncbi:uncharacterized protein ColSpa_01688 [Colletotrichum spaethianum]|uniref:Uncharacterized protein n=1 Tax=Colletotrichum spaethianum TaxID=700344 RepID=A0AA37L434_9PEZI|nr:uncharacterized protein ColSpa_01688 [Colletotrichum spaethianum]GKT41507.1 hypothetical protein ColSpa_01688 [Colletotrichum spaethianum]
MDVAAKPKIAKPRLGSNDKEGIPFCLMNPRVAGFCDIDTFHSNFIRVGSLGECRRVPTSVDENGQD